MDPSTYLQLRWGDIENMINSLVKQATPHLREAPAIIGVGRGGWIPAAMLCYRLDINSFYTTRVLHSKPLPYKAPDCVDPMLIQRMVKLQQTIWFVDDLYDTGATLQYLHSLALSAGAPPETIRCLVLLSKKRSGQPNHLYGADYSKEPRWIVFPWENGDE